MFKLDKIIQKVEEFINEAVKNGSLKSIKEKDKIRINLCSLLLVKVLSFQ